jgi:hypothetical protein
MRRRVIADLETAMAPWMSGNNKAQSRFDGS